MSYPGKNPASKKPSRARHIVSICQLFTKPWPIITAPTRGDEGEPVGAADFAQHDVTRQFEQKVRREKHDKCDGVAVSHIQSKIGAHTCNAGICDVGAVDLQCVSEDSAALLEGGSRGR